MYIYTPPTGSLSEQASVAKAGVAYSSNRRFMNERWIYKHTRRFMNYRVSMNELVNS